MVVVLKAASEAQSVDSTTDRDIVEEEVLVPQHYPQPPVIEN